MVCSDIRAWETQQSAAIESLEPLTLIAIGRALDAVADGRPTDDVRVNLWEELLDIEGDTEANRIVDAVLPA